MNTGSSGTWNGSDDVLNSSDDTWNLLPHLGHHHILVLFIINGLDTVLHHDRQWNEPAMGNSVAAAGAMKSMSPSWRRGWRSTDAWRPMNTGSGGTRRSTNTANNDAWNDSDDVSNNSGGAWNPSREVTGGL
jgi:hypothetical protein